MGSMGHEIGSGKGTQDSRVDVSRTHQWHHHAYHQENKLLQRVTHGMVNVEKAYLEIHFCFSEPARQVKARVKGSAVCTKCESVPEGKMLPGRDMSVFMQLKQV